MILAEGLPVESYLDTRRPRELPRWRRNDPAVPRLHRAPRSGDRATVGDGRSRAAGADGRGTGSREAHGRHGVARRPAAGSYSPRHGDREVARQRRGRRRRSAATASWATSHRSTRQLLPSQKRNRVHVHIHAPAPRHRHLPQPLAQNRLHRDIPPRLQQQPPPVPPAQNRQRRRSRPQHRHPLRVRRRQPQIPGQTSAAPAVSALTISAASRP